MDTQEQEEFEQDVEEVTEELEVEETEEEEVIEEESEEDAPEEEAEDVLVVNFAEEAEEEKSNPVRDLRKALREKERRIKELEAKEAEKASGLGEKPKLEDFDYDTDAFEGALLKWNEAKKVEDAKKAEQQEAQERREKAFQERLQAYREKAKALPVKDFEDVEDNLVGILSPHQQSVLVMHSKQPEILAYALGKNDKLANELAQETDLVGFAYKLAQLEAKMSVTGKMKPKPETRVRGKATVPVVGEKKLEAARKKAEETGDYTEVNRIKRELKAAKVEGGIKP